jgi:hypothetical protein
VPGPEGETLQAQFEERLSLAIYAQLAYYGSLKMQDRRPLTLFWRREIQGDFNDLGWKVARYIEKGLARITRSNRQSAWLSVALAKMPSY